MAVKASNPKVGRAVVYPLALAQFGEIDILINNAAIRPHKPFIEITLQDWERVRGVVLDGTFYCTHAVIPSMVKNNFGRVLFGDGAFEGRAQRAHVSAAKMGLVGLARGLASEFAPHNIRVNVVSPGRIDTSRDLSWYPGQNMQDTAGIPLGRMGHVDELTAACLFLVADDCGFITGQTLRVRTTATRSGTEGAGAVRPTPWWCAGWNSGGRHSC